MLTSWVADENATSSANAPNRTSPPPGPTAVMASRPAITPPCERSIQLLRLPRWPIKGSFTRSRRGAQRNLNEYCKPDPGDETDGRECCALRPQPGAQRVAGKQEGKPGGKSPAPAWPERADWLARPGHRATSDVWVRADSQPELRGRACQSWSRAGSVCSGAQPCAVLSAAQAG